MNSIILYYIAFPCIQFVKEYMTGGEGRGQEGAGERVGGRGWEGDGREVRSVGGRGVEEAGRVGE